MSTLTIDANAKPIQVLRPKYTTRYSLSGTATASGYTVGAGIRVVRIVSTLDCHYDPIATATTSKVFLPAGVVEYIHVYEGDQISMITSGATGYAYVTSMV
jgi:hypothetical protein|tara:strand:- start:1801 stop:2103 length:303 start_codon:yes stop_codon:yes gene_type:complete